MRQITNVELMSAKEKIKDLSRRIKRDATSIKEEMERIIDFADAVAENIDDATHFQMHVHNRTDWKNLPLEIAEANVRVQAYQSLRRVVKELE